MAPQPTYDSPQTQLALLADAARRRGMDFEAFWHEAVRQGRSLVMTNHPNPPPGCIRWPTDRNDRQAWMFAIHRTKEGWRRAYERVEPSSAERAVSTLGETIGMIERERERERAADAMDAQADVLSAA